MSFYQHAPRKDIICPSGIPAEVLRDQLLRVHGVTDYVSVGLPRPLATMIRTWVRTHQHEDLHTILTTLENALTAPVSG